MVFSERFTRTERTTLTLTQVSIIIAYYYLVKYTVYSMHD